jgi:exopolyphosphatase / guanosine-5'-triphosphate,3'-diphosphate pyrophosphatase
MNRCEFRIWGDDLSNVGQQLEVLSGKAYPTETDEIYFVSDATDDCNAKIRFGLLDIKVLLNVERGMEQWPPIIKAGFPLASNSIDQFFAFLKLDPPHLSRSSYSTDEFLSDVVGGNERIIVVKVHKHRNEYKLDGCEAEFAAVRIEGHPRQTIAVESSDPDAVLSVTDRLGIRSSANLGYEQEIKKLHAERRSD